ncbi:FAD-dependent oxidoreductase [Granulosicoccus antarcticus]|uniref:NADH:ubiquinone reductase (non-electrogenic) n=1 Tax=Granulosicoccus antarcticus IMCC3135 TaxID=1192854 RepID=A0A2Z2NSQ5_9GAMM|nr:FAD-dependent oxidoreductase [Granulosicoccus antarcticus]ASJ73545.1 NADH dehydrogenase-like protein [Granulosicoccus antarcticus IMCC3135]
MSETSKLLDRSELHTDTGVGILRIAAGLFFLVPGILKVIAPESFLAMTAHFPAALQSQLDWLFNLVIIAEILGGLMLIVGWNIRLAVPALVVITVIAESLVVINDTASNIRLLSLAAHLMGIGLYSAMFFLGSGRWAIGRGRSVLHWLASRDAGRLSKAAHSVTSGAGRNVGVFLIRASVSIPFIAAFWLGLTDEAYQSVLLEPIWFRNILLLVSLIGGLSMLTGFQTNTMSWVLAALALLHLATVGIADASSSQIGIINILFHLLIIAAVVSLRLINFGSDLEVAHILSLDKKNVVVVGGGFAGTQLVRKLERKLPNDWQVVLISEENYTTFNPMLAEVVGASILPSHVIAPIRRMIRKTRFISARLTSVDIEGKTVSFEGEERDHVLAYEHLVFAFGSRANMELVPGMAEHAMPFKLLGDALALRNRVIEQMEKAEQEEDAETRRWLGHFVIIGAGFSGAEIGGAIQDFIHASHKHYPRLHDDDLAVTLIHRGEVPLQELSPKLGEHAMQRMLQQGIRMRMSTGVSEVDARGVVTDKGARVEGATVISTIGTRSNPLMETMDVPVQRGRITVEPDMSISGHEGLWAIGDCAAIPNAHDGNLAPPTAQFAIREGHQLADNIAQAIAGKPTNAFNYDSKGSMATIGHLNGVAEISGGIRLGGFPAWLLWRAFYLSLMPTMAKKTRILFEWTWSMLFSPDIINLRFTTTENADKSREERRRD